MNKELKKRFRSTDLLFLDVDGILTDGRIHFLEDGSQFRSFHVTDGLGLKMLLRAGVEVVIVSAGKSDAVVYRLRQLGIQNVFQDISDKKGLVERFLMEGNFSPSRAAFVGDDLTDVQAMAHVGLALSVPGAHRLALEVAHYVTATRGGDGAVREICEIILREHGANVMALLREG